uniref:SR-related CTD-associated factor 1 n=1 Tax=Kryptolebias marmoratus TaxID=37003 RepID=A0A3Q3F1H1_KRYMA
MDLSPAPVFKRRPSATSSPVGVGETARSPALHSTSSSPSSHSSSPSSPLSTSSSFCANSSAYQNHVKSQKEVARVSSSSASLTRQPLSAYNATSVDCFPCMSMQSSVDCEEDDRKGEMYDPFSPTDGDKERRMEEEEGEKYDPFDPTGSPASDVDDGIGKEREINTNAEIDDEDKEEEPPDSTDTLTDQLSPYPATQLSLRRRVESSTSRAEGQKESADSDHSEIEEGEIVTAVDKDGTIKRLTEKVLSPNSPQVSFFSSKPERILRVLDGDGFVSVCTEGNWEDDRELENEPVVGVEDLRRKLVSRRKERYRSFPASSPLSSQPPLPPSLPQASMSSSPLMVSVEQAGKNQKSFKSSNDLDQQKIKDRKAGDKEVRRKKRRKGKEGEKERSKEKEQGHKAEKEIKTRRSSRSTSRKRKKRRHSSPETSHNSRRRGHSRHSFSSLSEERQKEQKREKDKDRNRDRDRDRDRERGRSRDRERDKERHHHRSSSHRKDERVQDSSSRKREKERTDKRHSRSRERDLSRRSRRSRERRDDDRERQHEREHRRDGRPVVPPSIQDLNGSDLFAIKRTITVTTTTTTTTVPGSPRLATVSPSHPTKVDNSHKRKKRKWRSTGDTEDRKSCHSRSHSLSPLRYHGYESDRYSEKLEVDMLSLDGEALDSDYPSLEDTPPAALPPELPVPSPKAKAPPKAKRNHPKKKSYTLKKSESSSSSNRTTSKCLSSLTVTSGSASVSSGLPLAKRGRKMGKDKGSRKDLSRSGKSKKESGSGRKGKLQSKVSVLVREGVSSTTGTSVGSGKLSMDLLGPGGTGGGAGGSVVGGSIAVVFCRDNESRSPFLKPCSEPLSLSSRSKDLASMGKRSSLAAPPSTLTSSTALKSKKTKTGSITSTSSSASSPSSSLATKRRRRLAKKTIKKSGGAGLAAGDGSQTKPLSEGWGGGLLDVQSAVGEGSKSVSPHTVQAGPPPCSSSSSTSSSTSALPPSTSPPHSPPPSTAPLRDTRESSPDSQTVDSSCKTPDPSFLAEDCPTQTSPIPLASSPSSLSTPQGASLNNALSTPTAKPPPPDDTSKSLASPPCSSSSASLTSFSLPLSSSDPSSSSVSSSSASKPPPPPPPPPPSAASALPWSLQTGVDCTTGGVLALTALLFKMEEANIASRAKAQEFIQATSQYLKKLHTQERAVEEVKLAIKPYYQRKDINKDEYKDILRKAVHKICHSRTGEINPVKVSNLVKLYVQRYKYFRKHGRKMDDEERDEREPGALHTSA